MVLNYILVGCPCYSCNSPKNHFHKGWLVSKYTGLNCIIKLIIEFNTCNSYPLILYLHKGNHMNDCNFIMLFLVLFQKQTFLHQSTQIISLFIYQFRTFYAHLSTARVQFFFFFLFLSKTP